MQWPHYAAYFSEKDDDQKVKLAKKRWKKKEIELERIELFRVS